MDMSFKDSLVALGLDNEAMGSPHLAVLPGILAGISEAYTALLPLFILEGRGKRIEQLRCTSGPMTLHPGAWLCRVVITRPWHLQPPTIHPNIVGPLAHGLVL